MGVGERNVPRLHVFQGSADDILDVMPLVWPRCPKCGRRWRAEHPACGTEVAPRETTATDEGPLPVLEGLVSERVLGKGGFGEVFLARRVSDGRKVAVKIPNADADAIMRLELEGETLAPARGRARARALRHADGSTTGAPAW